MSREWKPGDVAMVTYYDPPVVAIVRPRQSAAGQLEFAYSSGGYDMVAVVAGLDDYARPLVVIDPEDHEQVERLAQAYREQTHAELGPYPMPLPAYRMQAALREFANPTPPRPDEPTGLGAVVEDAEGTPWVRINTGRWVNDAERSRGWNNVAAVKILSDGVQT